MTVRRFKLTENAIGLGLFAALLLSACGADSPAVPTQCGNNAPACALGSQSAPSAAPSVLAGTWSGTVTRRWSETVSTSGSGVSSAITQTYEATVQVSSVQVDVSGWELVGQAIVKASFDSDGQSHQTTPLGPCNTHYTDNVPLTTFSGAVTGGLEITDGFYQFHVDIPGFDTAMVTSVRDDSGCFGAKTTETNPWSAAPVTVGGNGNASGSSISGSTTTPVADGQDINTWNLTRS